MASTYASEAALCADFIAWVKRQSGQVVYGRRIPVWTAYAETAGWDILLVAEDGTQIGIEAKLKFNMKVLAQALPERWAHWHDSGPDYRAVLVPDLDHQQANICAHLGLMLFARSPHSDFEITDGGRGGRSTTAFAPGLDLEHADGWHYWSPTKRCELPEFIPDVTAGSPAPVQLTKWKIAALRICAALEVKGYVTREDFRRLQVDPRRWLGPSGWVRPSDTPGQYVRGDGLDFDKQHPAIFAQLLEEAKARLLESIS